MFEGHKYLLEDLVLADSSLIAKNQTLRVTPFLPNMFSHSLGLPLPFHTNPNFPSRESHLQNYYFLNLSIYLGEGNGNPLLYSFPEIPHEQRSLAGHGVTKSWT